MKEVRKWYLESGTAGQPQKIQTYMKIY
jgi:hypothetical protein